MQQPSPPSTRWKDSSISGSKPRKGTSSPPTPSPSLGSAHYTPMQARLDSISSPSDQWYWGALEGANRWRGVGQTEKASIAARLSQDCLTLKGILEEALKVDPPTMTGPEWLRLHHRLRRWQGLLSSLEE